MREITHSRRNAFLEAAVLAPKPLLLGYLTHSTLALFVFYLL